MKRGVRSQTTIFILIAIIILGVIAISFFVVKKPVSGNLPADANLQAQFNAIKSSVEDCMKTTSEDALKIIGIQGGYYKEPKETYSFGWMFIPYFYKEGTFFMPTKEKVESELSSYVDEKLDFCFKNLDIGNFKLTYGKPKTKTTISSGKVLFNIDMPVSVSKSEKIVEFELKDMPVLLNSKLFEILEIAKYINDANKNFPRVLCFSCLSKMVGEKNLLFDSIELDNNVRLYVLTENKDSPYYFEFVEKYNGEITNVKP
jgi:hypothetical protein